MEEQGLCSQAPSYYCNFSEENIHNKDNFYQSGYYPRKVGPFSIIGSDQQDHLAQYLVSNWPLADAEGRVRTGQAIMPLVLGGKGREDSSFLSYFEKKTPRKASKYVNSGGLVIRSIKSYYYGVNGASHALLKSFPHSLLLFGKYLLPAWISQT